MEARNRFLFNRSMAFVGFVGFVFGRLLNLIGTAFKKHPDSKVTTGRAYICYVQKLPA